MHRLNDWLGRHGEDLGSFDELDGFITAIALLPLQLSPALWYPNILGGMTDAETEARVEQAEREGVLDLLVRHWRHVVRRLAREEPWEAAVCDDEFFSPDFWWAAGFRQGMARSKDYWEDLAAMQDWPERLPAIGMLLDPSERADRRRRSLEEREALLRQAEQEITRFYREVRRAG